MLAILWPDFHEKLAFLVYKKGVLFERRDQALLKVLKLQKKSFLQSFNFNLHKFLKSDPAMSFIIMHRIYYFFAQHEKTT
jgi:hypothetical protein